MTDRATAAAQSPGSGLGRFGASLVRVGLLVAALAAVAAIGSAFGSRLGLWSFRDGFAILTWGAYGGLAGAVLSLLALLWPRAAPGIGRLVPAAMGLVLGLAVFGYPAWLRHVGNVVPRMHDVTTDTQNPPAFVATLPLRTGAENAVAYEGAALAKLQHQGYPLVKPMILSALPARVFAAALTLVADRGWDLAAAVPAEGHIEATATSFWYRFKDDVVLRVAPEGTGTRVDMRSLSRVGKSDFGVNARRVENFLSALGERVAGN